MARGCELVGALCQIRALQVWDMAFFLVTAMGHAGGGVPLACI